MTVQHFNFNSVHRHHPELYCINPYWLYTGRQLRLHVVILFQHTGCYLYTSLYLALRSTGPWWLWTVNVRLSGYCPGQYPSMHPPLSCHAGQLILSPHMHMRRHRLWSDICPPTPAPSPENSYRGYYSLVCVKVGMAGRCPRWWFLGNVSGEGANARHALHIDAVTILFFVCCSFMCGEMWHDPVQCKVLKMWIKKCDDDSETSNWLAANTKATVLLSVIIVRPDCYATYKSAALCYLCHTFRYVYVYICFKVDQGPTTKYLTIYRKIIISLL